MLSVYSGMDVNFTQSFPTPFGLARSRVAAFEPQEASRQQQQSLPPPYPTTNLSSSVSLVDPMLQSNILVDPISTSTPPPPPTSSSSPPASLMYYDSYSSPFLPNTAVASSGTTNVSVSSSPSLDDSWGYALSTDLLTESSHNLTFTPSSEPSPHHHQQQQPYLFSLDIPSYLSPPPPPPPSSQHQYHQGHEKQLLYPSSSGMHACDPVPNLLSSHGYPFYQQNVCDGFSSSQTPVVTYAIITSPTSPTSTTSTTITNSSQRSNKRKRTQSSSPMSYSKPGRSVSMSPSSCSDTTRQQGPRPSKHPRHYHVGNVESNRPLSSTGSLSPKSEQGCTATATSGSIPYSSMNMISSFPTKINVSSNTSTKRYECHICTKKFTRPSSLTTHIYSHTKEKPFKCPVEGCGRHFSVVSNLRRHAKIHSNPSNSKC